MTSPSPHFAVKCPCGQMVAVPISPLKIDDDPTVILRSLGEKDQREIGEFWDKHEIHGDLVPCVVDIQPIEKG